MALVCYNNQILNPGLKYGLPAALVTTCLGGVLALGINSLTKVQVSYRCAMCMGPLQCLLSELFYSAFFRSLWVTDKLLKQMPNINTLLPANAMLTPQASGIVEGVRGQLDFNKLQYARVFGGVASAAFFAVALSSAADPFFPDRFIKGLFSVFMAVVTAIALEGARTPRQRR